MQKKYVAEICVDTIARFSVMADNADEAEELFDAFINREQFFQRLRSVAEFEAPYINSVYEEHEGPKQTAEDADITLEMGGVILHKVAADNGLDEVGADDVFALMVQGGVPLTRPNILRAIADYIDR